MLGSRTQKNIYIIKTVSRLNEATTAKLYDNVTVFISLINSSRFYNCIEDRSQNRLTGFGTIDFDLLNRLADVECKLSQNIMAATRSLINAIMWKNC